jgi:hypothetical protein
VCRSSSKKRLHLAEGGWAGRDRAKQFRCDVAEPGCRPRRSVAVFAEMTVTAEIIFRLTAALKTEITFKDGRAEQSNFHD